MRSWKKTTDPRSGQVCVRIWPDPDTPRQDQHMSYLIIGYLMGAGSIGSYGVIGTVWGETNAADGKRALSAFDRVF